MAPTQPVSFRFTADDLAELDQLAELLTHRLSQLTGTPVGYPYTRSMALRYAVRWTLGDHERLVKETELVSAAGGD
jgi:hypothetical protein